MCVCVSVVWEEGGEFGHDGPGVVVGEDVRGLDGDKVAGVD